MMPETWARTSATRVEARRPGRSKRRGTVAGVTVATDTSGVGVSTAAVSVAAGLQPVSDALTTSATRIGHRKPRAVEIDMDQNSPLTERDPAHRSAES